MANMLAVEIRCQVAWVLQESADLSTITDASRLEYGRPLVDGTGLDQADRLWHRQRTLAPGASDDWDLTELPATLFGSAISIAMARVKLLQVIHVSTGAGHELRVMGGGAAPWAAFLGGSGPFWRIPADSCGLAVNRREGWPVSSGTADTLRIHNPSGAPSDYQLVLVGTSA